MTVKTKFSQQDFNLILSGYELGSFTHSEPISQGTVQTNYFIHTNQGKYVFRYYENRIKESVLFESELLVYLKTHKYPSPAPYRNRDGNYLGMFQGKPFMILDYIDGEHIENPSEHHKQQVIQMVAELQNLTVTYQPRYKVYRWNYNIELCRVLATTEAQKINTQNAHKKLKWCEYQLSMLDLPETLPKGICHCDFHFSNLLFHDDQFVGLLDF